MITYYRRTIKDHKLTELKKFEKGCWIHAVHPSKEEIEYLHKTFSLDKQNLRSGLDKYEVPRVEFVNKNLYAILKIISPPPYEKVMHTILIVVGNDFILTLSKYKPVSLEKIFQSKIKFITTQKLKCLLWFFSLINRDFEYSTNDIVRLVNAKKESIRKLNEKDINILLEQESILNNFVSAYYHTNLVYERIKKNIRFYEQDNEILDDLMIEAKQGFELCELSLKTISNIRNHFEVLVSHKLNKIITLLTVFTVLISLPAAISGIYGMNIALPMQENPYAFSIIVFIIVLLWAGLLFYFKKTNVI
ncbi:MAG: magnesium transporter CorA family protein [Candidatus Aenigmarchaeota archaeon]|nr:magnesium transporter CorA family protein [Candidatus Aenigmarchaeota archaeon]